MTRANAGGVVALAMGLGAAGWRAYRGGGAPEGWQAVGGALTRTGLGGTRPWSLG
jgi:hypothetical protein